MNRHAGLGGVYPSGTEPIRDRSSRVAYPSRVSLYTLHDTGDLIDPVMLAAFDGWVDAGSAATTALGILADDGEVVATFDADRLFDYRARRPPLEIVDGRLTELTWHELVVRRTRLEERDLLVLVGPEPDYRWRALTTDVIDLTRRLGVVEWISLGAIPAAVPHTRAVPIMGTEATPGLLRGTVAAGPAGTLRVPSALVSALEIEVAAAGIPALGYFAQVPHYVSGPYATAALELLRALGTHFGTEIAAGELTEEARELRTRLDSAASADDTTRAYVERLESMYDEQRLPSGRRPHLRYRAVPARSGPEHAGRQPPELESCPRNVERPPPEGDDRRHVPESSSTDRRQGRLPAPPPPGIPPRGRRAAGRRSRCPAVRSR